MTHRITIENTGYRITVEYSDLSPELAKILKFLLNRYQGTVITAHPPEPDNATPAAPRD